MAVILAQLNRRRAAASFYFHSLSVGYGSPSRVGLFRRRWVFGSAVGWVGWRVSLGGMGLG
jgi:hypothetical protein